MDVLSALAALFRWLSALLGFLMPKIKETFDVISGTKTVLEPIQAMTEKWGEQKVQEIKENRAFGAQLATLAKYEAAQNCTKMGALAVVYAVQAWALVTIYRTMVQMADRTLQRRHERRATDGKTSYVRSHTSVDGRII